MKKAILVVWVLMCVSYGLAMVVKDHVEVSMDLDEEDREALVEALGDILDHTEDEVEDAFAEGGDADMHQLRFEIEHELEATNDQESIEQIHEAIARAHEIRARVHEYRSKKFEEKARAAEDVSAERASAVRERAHESEQRAEEARQRAEEVRQHRLEKRQQELERARDAPTDGPSDDGPQSDRES